MAKSSKEQMDLRVDGKIVTLTSPDKPLWPQKNIQKIQYIQYLTQVAPSILPFLKDRLLTVIRYPHGAGDERFYQKNCPDYAPDFILTHYQEDNDYILCNNLPTLLWLGNQLAFEFHIPFRTIHTKFPSEIVMDLDPPSREEFQLSVHAALIIKDICDKFKLITFIKTSGNKGMQIYIPLPENKISFADARLFTEFLAHYLIEKEPKWFTIERLKKNRGNKCYIDYIQHAEGKTIISPYSVRGNDEALVATPLYWSEVKESLRPEPYDLLMIENRIKTLGDPFQSYFNAKSKQPIDPIIAALKEKSL